MEVLGDEDVLLASVRHRKESRGLAFVEERFEVVANVLLISGFYVPI